MAPNLASPTLEWADWFAAGPLPRSRSPQGQLEFHPEQAKSSEPGNVIDFVAAKVTILSHSPTGVSPTDKWTALVKLASLVETRWHAVAADCASRRATLGTVFVRLERTSAHLFIFKGLFMVRHIKDYAMGAINGTLTPRGDTHFVRTVGFGHKQAIVGEGFCVLTGGVVALEVAAVSRRAS
jgi:hypothetical protein